MCYNNNQSSFKVGVCPLSVKVGWLEPTFCRLCINSMAAATLSNNHYKCPDHSLTSGVVGLALE